MSNATNGFNNTFVSNSHQSETDANHLANSAWFEGLARLIVKIIGKGNPWVKRTGKVGMKMEILRCEIELTEKWSELNWIGIHWIIPEFEWKKKKEKKEKKMKDLFLF